jgi:hypothetical protein
MADNSEEFDFAAASKAEIDKAKEDQKKQKQTSFEEEVDAYLVEKYPLEYVEDASGKRQYNPESNRYRREGKPEAEQVVARRRAREHIAANPELQKTYDNIQGVYSQSGDNDLSKQMRLKVEADFPPPNESPPIGKKWEIKSWKKDASILAPGQKAPPAYPIWGLGNDPSDPRLAQAQPRPSPKPSRKRPKRKKKKPKPLLGVEFDEQAFLWDHIQYIHNEEPTAANIAAQKERRPLLGDDYEPNVHADEMSSQTFPFEYKNFIQLTSDDPSTTNNKLWGFGADSLNDLTTTQLSSLIPLMRIYKVIEGEDGKPRHIDFPFNKFTTMQSILDSKENRGTDAGLIGIDWEDTGQTPAESGLSFKGQIQLRFQSLEGIFKERMVDGEKISFGDLLYLKGALGRSLEPSKDIEQLAPGWYIGSELEPSQNCPKVVESINMEIGWTIPDSPELNLDKNNLKDALKLLRRTYTLTIFNQEIDITDNGDVGLRLDFTAGIDGRSLSTMSDLLQLDVNNLSDNDDVDFQIAELRGQQFELEEKISDSTQQQRRERTKKKAATNKVTQKRIQGRINKMIADQKEYQAEIKTLDSEISSVAFSRLLTTLTTGLNKDGSSRVKYIDLTKDAIDIYKHILDAAARKYKESKDASKDRQKEIIDLVRTVRQEHHADMLGELPENWLNEMGANIKNPLSLADKTPTQQSATTTKENKPSSLFIQAPTPQIVEGNYRIHYVFLGDIIEAAMSILYDPRTTKKNALGRKKAGKCPIVQEAIKVILGPFTFPDPWSGDTQKRDLADIPVSLSYFNAWWYNKAIGKNRKNYFLRTFLSDLCRELLNNVVSPKRYGGMPGKAPLFQVTPYTCPAAHPLNEKWKNTKNRPKQRMKVSDLMPGGRFGYKPGYQTKFSDWLYLYGTNADMSRTSHFDGDMEEDAKIYLPHFFTGANKGIIKSIKFQKTKLPGLTEAMIARAYNQNEGKKVKSNLIFTSRYDSTVTLFGNPAYKPGMYIYIDPRSMGVGISSSFRDRVENDLGIGGYYLIYRVRHKISDGEYTTELQVKMHFGIREILGKRAESKKKKNKA